MNPSHWKVAGASLVVLTMGVYLAYRWCWIGKIGIQTAPDQPAAYDAFDSSSRVAILVSGHTMNFLRVSDAFEAHAEYWQKLLQSLKASCDLISDSQLESSLKGYRVLVLPSALCLSEKERKNIKAFLKDGGGVICTWATGARDEKGIWKGTGFLQELTGADTFEFTSRPAPWFVSFRGGSPMTAGAPTAVRVQVASPERMEATELKVDGYWSDVRLFPVDLARPADFQGAVVHHLVDRGRVVWYGFQENSAVGERRDREILDTLLANGLAWAGRRALCAVEPWPAQHPAAVLLGLDVEDNYENAAYAANALLKSGTKGTFFCLSNLVKNDQDLVKLLQRAGELASHGDTHRDFNDPLVLAQFLRLESSSWTLWRLGGHWPAGFHPPEDVLNPRTLQALAGTGFRYYLVGREADSALPVILDISESWGALHRNLALVKLSRLADDDLHLSPLGIVGLKPQWIVQRVLSDFEVVNGLGGLYVLAYHTQGLCLPEYASVLSQLFEQFRSSSAWVATAGEIAEWWKVRSRLSVEVVPRGDRSFRLTVTSRAERPAEQIALSVYPPSDWQEAHGAPVGTPTTALQVVSDPAKERLELLLGKIEPRRTYTFELTLNP